MSLVVDKAKTFRATPAVTVLEQQAFDDTARLLQHRAQMLGDGGAQFALVPGMRRGQLFELGYDCRPVEQIRRSRAWRRGWSAWGTGIADQARRVTGGAGRPTKWRRAAKRACCDKFRIKFQAGHNTRLVGSLDPAEREFYRII